jgi:hypothetical protein
MNEQEILLKNILDMLFNIFLALPFLYQAAISLLIIFPLFIALFVHLYENSQYYKEIWRFNHDYYYFQPPKDGTLYLYNQKELKGWIKFFWR